MNKTEKARKNSEAKLFKRLKEEPEYILLNEDFVYKNNKQRLKIKHTACGTIYETSAVRFINGSMCRNKKCIQKKIEETNLRKYGVKVVTQNKKVKEKARNTLKEKYGVENPSQMSDHLEKIRKTNLDKYGVESYSKTDEYKEKVKQTNIERYGVEWATQNNSIKEKTKKTCLERYGVEHFNSLKENTLSNKRKRWRRNYQENILNFKEIIPLFPEEEYIGNRPCVTTNNFSGIKYPFECKVCKTKFEDILTAGKTPRCPTCYPYNYRVSVAEKQIAGILREKIEIEENKFFTFNNKRYELDIFIPSLNIGFEYDGIYYHSQLSGNKERNYHLNKDKFFEDNFNIKIFHIWENEWLEKKDIVSSILLSKIGKTSNRIYARKCEIREVQNTEADIFLEENHIQGKCGAKIKLGLYYQNMLVSLLTFSKPRYNKKYEWEIVRFCNILNTSVVGGFSKLLKYFKKTYSPQSIITYADKRYSYGDLYEKNGFTLLRESKPNYFYTFHKNSTLFSRNYFQKHKLKDRLEVFNENISEWENMKNNGYDRIWDCGNKVFEWNKEE